MKAYNFEFDNLLLSDFGMVIASFDSGGVETIQNGGEITFNTVPTMNGQVHYLASSVHEDCITATFQICKNACDYPDMEISVEDMRDIMRWLNRKGFHKFRLIDYDGEYSGIYFMGSFNVSRIEIGGRIVGFELELFTNSPYAFHEPVTINIDTIGIDEITGLYDKKSVFSKSDQEGYIYPDTMEITIRKDGDLEIYNSQENRVMKIANCKEGEVVTVNYPMIASSLPSHKILNDFNWVFFRIATTFKNKLNEITTSLPCSIKIVYTPIVKVGI